MKRIGLHLELLNSFEVSVVVMIVLGFVITGLIFFSTLTPRQQTNVAGSFEIFDIHQQAAQVEEAVSFVLDIPNQFYNQFYIAFTQVATLPPGVVDGSALPLPNLDKVAYDFSNFVTSLSDQVASNYEIPQVGQVAGISISVSQQLQPVTLSRQLSTPAPTSLFDQEYQHSQEMYFVKNPPKPEINYEYQAPKLSQMFSKVDWMKLK